MKQNDRITNDKLGLNFFKGGIDVMWVYSNICTHPINMLFEILSKCPLYLSHGPAALFYTKARLIEIL